MRRAETELPEVYLQPGEAHLAPSPSILKTVLGSCVGVSFWHPRSKMGALCHGVLPHCPEGISAPEGFRYVDFSIYELLRQLECCGALSAQLEIKVFGGADVIEMPAAASYRPTVGRLNWHIALEVLQQEGLKVTARDLGGQVGRTIRFDTDTGVVLLKRLPHLRSETKERVKANG